MGKLKVIVIREYDRKPGIPAKIVSEIDEDEIRERFLEILKLSLIGVIEGKRFYNSKKFARDDIVEVARDSFNRALTSINRTAQVRVKP